MVGEKMKFKTPEDILKPHEREDANDYHYIEIGVVEAFKSFAERVEFYKKYRNEAKLLMDDDLELFNKFLINVMKYKTTEERFIYVDIDYIEGYCLEEYNDWLFDYCFGDVK